MSTHRDEVFRKLTIAEPLTPAMVVLLIVFAVVFALQVLLPPFRTFALNYLAMDTGAFLAKLRLWQALTAIFLHGGVCHFIFNMAFFWFFGSQLANAWHRREFLAFFFTCGIVASLCFYAFNVVRSPAAVKGFGASGAVFGLMVVYAMVYGDRMLLVFFLIPMKAKYFVAICFGIELLLLYGTLPDGIAHVAHLGGGVCGAIYLKVVQRRQSALAGATRGRAKAKSRIDGLEIDDHAPR